MKFSTARSLLASRGYSLVARDEAKRGKPVCCIYAARGKEEYLLCNLSAFPFASVRTFQAWVAELPPVGSDEVVS